MKKKWRDKVNSFFSLSTLHQFPERPWNEEGVFFHLLFKIIHGQQVSLFILLTRIQAITSLYRRFSPCQAALMKSTSHSGRQPGRHKQPVNGPQASHQLSDHTPVYLGICEAVRVCTEGTVPVRLRLTLQVEDRILPSQKEGVCYGEKATCSHTCFAEQICTFL